jgi:hypothetical protein
LGGWIGKGTPIGFVSSILHASSFLPTLRCLNLLPSLFEGDARYGFEKVRRTALQEIVAWILRGAIQISYVSKNILEGKNSTQK